LKAEAEMKKLMCKYALEAGQLIPIVVLLLFVILGMVALILDGGSIMSNRRTAQAAADAGALAGAQRLCEGKSDAKAVAEYYAAVINDATLATATINGHEVTVNAIVEQPSFFANIFGQPTLPASANATAGCYYPSKAQRVLPIAFYYEAPPIKANAADCTDPSQPCSLVNWDYGYLLNTLSSTGAADLPLDNIYIISESTKICEKDIFGEIICADMKPNASGGNRTWIDLNALNDPPKNLKKIIQEGLDHPIQTPAWVNGEEGTNAAVYNETNFAGLDPISGYTTLETRLLVVPVFDQYCESDPQINCADPGDNFYLVNSNQSSYRLVGLAPFVITCVTKNEKCEFGQCIPAKTGPNTTNKDICPGYLYSDPTNQDGNAIEGYFVDNLPTDTFTWGTTGVDVGLFVISLSQ
jgi:hypothetical protein